MMKLLRYIIVVVFIPFQCFAAFFDLEITNIKASGTGSPAISSNNRIFHAYQGIEYNIRAAVIGGLYPYTYSLSNAPSGMTINSATGEIIWPNPQANSGTITLSVTDSENTTVTSTWTITVTNSTSKFVFVQSGYVGTESGSITQPYSSILNMLNAESSTSKIVYLRAGTYYYPEFNSNPNPHWMDLNNSPNVWIAYPSETVVLQGSSSGTNSHTIYNNANTVYFDGLTINDGLEYTMLLSNSPYTTIRRCKFNRLTTATSVNNNQGMIYMPNGAGVQSYIVIQDNEFTGFTGGEAIGSLYRTNKILIENNYTHDGGVSDGLNYFCTPIGIKTTNTYYTIRGNKIIMPSGAANFEIYNELTDQDYGEFSFNFVSKVSGSTAMMTFFYPETFLLRRNTFHGDIEWHTALSDGPYTFENNVLMGSLITPTYVTQTDNLTGTYSSSISDTNGLLTSSYTQYVGSRGWQFTNGSTPHDPIITVIGGKMSGGGTISSGGSLW